MLKKEYANQMQYDIYYLPFYKKINVKRNLFIKKLKKINAVSLTLF